MRTLRGNLRTLGDGRKVLGSATRSMRLPCPTGTPRCDKQYERRYSLRSYQKYGQSYYQEYESSYCKPCYQAARSGRAAFPMVARSSFPYRVDPVSLLESIACQRCSRLRERPYVTAILCGCCAPHGSLITALFQHWVRLVFSGTGSFFAFPIVHPSTCHRYRQAAQS